MDATSHDLDQAQPVPAAARWGRFLRRAGIAAAVALLVALVGSNAVLAGAYLRLRDEHQELKVRVHAMEGRIGGLPTGRSLDQRLRDLDQKTSDLDRRMSAAEATLAAFPEAVARVIQEQLATRPDYGPDIARLKRSTGELQVAVTDLQDCVRYLSGTSFLGQFDCNNRTFFLPP